MASNALSFFFFFFFFSSPTLYCSTGFVCRCALLMRCSPLQKERERVFFASLMLCKIVGPMGF